MKKSKVENKATDDAALMVARIRQTRADADAADAQQGAHDGEFWAKRTATFRDLRALEDVADDYRDPNQLDDEPGMGLAGAMAGAKNELFGEETSREYEFMDLFPSGGMGNSPSFVAGFVAAAMKVWREVKPLVAG